ncbi:DMT family transporter [Novosphingobium ginsenosidimutans]|uniref:EamA family transporter n=1 Tax=Novosphingobium ginsenosidimutans TaxID=1176536 RepID=A0A5B8S3K8_9SPHN|nr:EamA family transporter [Novosphingobium ginsenosidimutans]QEA15873.1 EamA family transporter [Novosphingobium ginsenosidimutans]
MSGVTLTPRSIAAFIFLALVWGSTWLVIKDQISEVPSAWSVVWRFILAATAMAAFALLRRERLRLTGREQAVAIAMGVFQFSVNFQLIYQSEHYLTSGLVAVVFALMIVPNAILARLVLGAALTRRFVAGSAIALAGIALLMLHEYRIAPPNSGVTTGVLLVTGAILSVSVGNLLQATTTARGVPVVSLMAWGMLWGIVASASYAIVAVGAPVLDPRPAYLAGIAYLGLVGSALTFPLYSQLIRDWGPGPAAYNGVAVPVVAMILSTLFEGYQWSLLAGAGAVLAMAGLLVALSGRK